ncbi:MAG: plasmid stabilization protein [Cytophagales bacterium CG12_big_fil_rev_8_21_14_0_65_40_12]|nr:MAG: plasmid stabilization protein [Cytophagales bacterium CG12_big_fil_rev_8_21_14_0_65_40_12]PIW04567.1 MAG: plasmid stabilization protein [Cytophagales bacterium CG17_big_fil_post_rev_8_21_14_2_50_40_13]
MAKDYHLSIAVEQDIGEIYDYGVYRFGMYQAVKYLMELDLVFTQIVKNPDLGKKRDEIKVGLRSLPKNSHVIFYRLLEDSIRIVRVLHGSRDLIKFLP